MRNAYASMIGGTLLLAAALGGIGMLVLPLKPVSPVSAKDAATASSGTASEQAAALEAAEQEARDNPPPPAAEGIVQAEPSADETPAAPSGYQGTAPVPAVQFEDTTQSADPDAPAQPVASEE